MLTVDKLRCKPKRFHPFTGLTPDEFDTLLLRVESVYAAAQESRLNYPCRQRALGAGHPFTLPVAERLPLIFSRLIILCRRRNSFSESRNDHADIIGGLADVRHFD